MKIAINGVWDRHDANISKDDDVIVSVGITARMQRWQLRAKKATYSEQLKTHWDATQKKTESSI